MLDSTLMKVKAAFPKDGAITHRDLMDSIELSNYALQGALKSLVALGVIEKIRLAKPRKTHGNGWTRYEYRLIGSAANSSDMKVFEE